MDNGHASSRRTGSTQRRGTEVLEPDARLAKTAIVVAGMHRSGTSALTRTLNLLGCDLPKTLIPGRPGDNDLGYWESRPAVDLSVEILEAAGTDTNDWTPFNEDWYSSPLAQTFHQRALEVLDDEFESSPFFVLKDPRLCRVLRFWLRVLSDFGAVPHVVSPIRSPNEVAASLEARDHMDPRHARLVWLRHVLDAELASRPVRRSFVRYDELVQHWHSVVERIGDDLQIAWPRRSVRVESEISKFLKPSQRHQRSDDQAVLADGNISIWVRSTYEILARWAAGDVREHDLATLDATRAAFDESASAFSQLFYSGMQSSRRARVAEDALAEREQELETAREQLLDLETLREQATDYAAAVEGHVAEALEIDAEVRRLEARLGGALERLLRTEVARRAAEAHAAEVEEHLEVERAEVASSSAELEAVSAALTASRMELAAQLEASRTELESASTQLADARVEIERHQRDKQRLRARIDAQRDEARLQRSRMRVLEREMAAIYASGSWRLTAPLRWLLAVVRRLLILGRSRPASAAPTTPPALMRPPVGAAKAAIPSGKRPAKPRAKLAAEPPKDADEYFAALAAMTGRGVKAVARDLAERERDLQARLHGGVVGEMVAKAGEVEPLVLHTWKSASLGRFFPFHSETRTAQMVAMYRLQEQAKRRRARAVVVIPHCRLSGATRIAGYLAGALAELHGPEEVVVLRTDRQDMRFPRWFPKGVRQVNFALEARPVVGEDRERLLVEFLRSLRPDAIYNVNSRLLWETTGRFGRPLSVTTELYAYLFCNEITPDGHAFGYPAKFFYRHFDLLSGVFTDSEYLAHELRTGFQLPPSWREKVVPLPTPAPAMLEPARMPDPSPARRRTIFWAGRFDRQKRLDVVLELARRLPDVQFRIWGERVLNDPVEMDDIAANVSLEGVYKSFEELPLDGCDLWLYTSAWDGVPNILLEAAAAGIPIVGSVAGGGGEVLCQGLAERVESVDDLEGFEAAIRRTLADPQAARQRAAKLRRKLLEERTGAVYRETLSRALSAGDMP